MSKFIAPSVDLPNDESDIILFGAEGIQLTTPFETIMLDKREYDAEVCRFIDIVLLHHW